MHDDPGSRGGLPAVSHLLMTSRAVREQTETLTKMP